MVGTVGLGLDKLWAFSMILQIYNGGEILLQILLLFGSFNIHRSILKFVKYIGGEVEAKWSISDAVVIPLHPSDGPDHFYWNGP